MVHGLKGTDSGTGKGRETFAVSPDSRVLCGEGAGNVNPRHTTRDRDRVPQSLVGHTDVSNLDPEE